MDHKMAEIFSFFFRFLHHVFSFPFGATAEVEAAAAGGDCVSHFAD